MKTKFSPVLKVKKQNLDKIEANLAKVRANAATLELNLAQIQGEILAREFPSNGTASDIQIALSQYDLLAGEKRRICEEIELNKKAILHFETQYKAAYIEFEKIKYLHDEEIKEFFKRAKVNEAKTLDEIATQRYFLQKAQN